MYKTNKIGPRQLPWITPLMTYSLHDRELPTLVHWVRADKKPFDPGQDTTRNAITQQFVTLFLMTHTIERFRIINIGDSNTILIIKCHSPDDGKSPIVVECWTSNSKGQWHSGRHCGKDIPEAKPTCTRLCIGEANTMQTSGMPFG